MAKILLVEDDNNLREIYGARLTAEGYDIVSAPDGEEALAIAVKEKPDLIITDVMMPKISGFDMLDILRNAPETKDTKIIMMTALSQAEDKERADKLGADLYLVKSQVTLEDVAASVRKILGGEVPDQDAAPSTDAGTTAPEPSETEPTVDAVAQPEVKEEPTPPVSAGPQLSGQPAAPPDTTPPKDEAAPGAAASIPVQAPEVQPEPTPAPIVTPSFDTNAQPAPEPAPTVEATPQPQPDSSESTQPAPPPTTSEPKKIEVVLPDDNEAPNAPTDENKPEKEPAKEDASSPVLEPAVDSGAVGPSLAEALADEEKTIKDQIKDFEEKPPQPEPTIIKPEPSSATDSTPVPSDGLEDNTPPQPAAPKTEGGERVINPINDPTKGPDLDALIAKEAGEAPSAPAPSATIEPDPSKVNQPSDNDNNGHPDDFSKISL